MIELSSLRSAVFAGVGFVDGATLLATLLVVSPSPAAAMPRLVVGVGVVEQVSVAKAPETTIVATPSCHELRVFLGACV